MAGHPSLPSTPLSTSSLRSHLPRTTAFGKHYRISENEFIKTSVAQSKANEDIKFSNNSKTNKDQLKKFKMLLEDCKLMTLASKARKPLMATPDNSFGFVDASISVCPITLAETITQQDDCIFQHSDKQRLFTLLFNAIASDLHYLMQSEIDKRDGISIFAILEQHINGTQNKDIRAAKKILVDIKLASSKTIHENVALLEDTFRNVDIATSIPISHQDKLYWPQDKLQDDARVEVR